MFQVTSFTGETYIGAPTDPTLVRNQKSRDLSSGMRATGLLLDRHPPSYVRINMKAQNNLSVWSIIERLQRRLERQGMSAAEADRAVAAALRSLALARA
jgi:hypothetical protein